MGNLRWANSVGHLSKRKELFSNYLRNIGEL
jgi:hypothetical protein